MATPARTSCSDCALGGLCPARGPGSESLARLSAIARRMAPLPDGAHLFWQTDALRAVYVVRRGCIKSYSTDSAGNERVRGFYLPGDLLGLDGVAGGRHPGSAQALGRAEVCALPYRALEGIADQLPALRQRLLRLASRELDTALALSGDYTADQRLAAFLLMIWHRAARPGKLVLKMSRRDIANHLRLVSETVSRVLGRFRDQGLVAVSQRAIELRDPAALGRLAEPVVGKLGDQHAGQPRVA